MTNIAKLWSLWKENTDTILKIKDENQCIENELLAFFITAWNKKYGSLSKETYLKMELYDPSDRRCDERELKKEEAGVRIVFIDRFDYEYDSTVIPIKAFLKEELDPRYLVTLEDTRQLKEKKHRLSKEREEYERLKAKFG
jgi:hypothetical protein